MRKLTASQRFDRLKELEARREELTSKANNLKSRIQQHVGKKQKLEEDLRWETGQRPPNAYSTRPARKGELEELKNNIQGLELQIKELENEYQPIQAELAEIDSEFESLERNPGKVTLTDLGRAREAISKVSAEIARIEKANEEVASRVQSSDIDNLKNSIEEAAAERDLLAADVDLGEASEADLKKASTKLTGLKKQLAELEEASSLAGATQRGYAHRLDRLGDEQRAAEKEFSCLLTMYARELFEQEVKRLDGALKEIESALAGLAVSNQLSEQHGDGTMFARMAQRGRVDLPHIPGIENNSVEPQQEVIEERVTEILTKIGKG